MSGKRIGLAAAVAVLLAAGGLLGGILSDSPSGRAAPPPQPSVAADQALSGFSLGDTKGLVAQLQSLVRENPKDGRSLTLLGLAYQQSARETGDPAYYTKSEGVLERALALDPNDLLATSGLGSLALARHDFEEALSLGEKARAISPTTARNYGVIGDALIELGRYSHAFEAFNRMASLKPSLASYTRISYARELLGDIDGAVEAMELAVDAARGAQEPTAWTLVQLGKIHWTVGRLDEAEEAYRQALEAYPGYVYALEALARVEGARADYSRAIELAKRAVETVPLPQFVALLGDLYVVSGQKALAGEQYALMDAIQQVFSANGVKTELETAAYYADHGIRLDEALGLARVAQGERPSIDGDDALAWALERTGRCEEALDYSKRALRLGTLDATKFFHRGMIERCLGHEQAAERWFSRAVDLNPEFSLLWARVAREAVA
jgi:tetratricopeptide (TPR) repeat protein